MTNLNAIRRVHERAGKKTVRRVLREKGWTLFTYDRNDKSIMYPSFDSDVPFEDTLKEIDRDPTCVFWG